MSIVSCRLDLQDRGVTTTTNNERKYPVRWKVIS